MQNIVTCLDGFHFSQENISSSFISPSAHGAQNSDSDKGTKGYFLEVLLFMESMQRGWYTETHKINSPLWEQFTKFITHTWLIYSTKFLENFVTE